PERRRVSGGGRCAGQVPVLRPTAGLAPGGGHPLGPGCFSCPRQRGARCAVRVAGVREVTGRTGRVRPVRRCAAVHLSGPVVAAVVLGTRELLVTGHGSPPIPSRPPWPPRAPPAHPRPRPR